MTDFSRFRTSFGGFNREDVVNFIEKISFEHQNEVQTLKKELEQLHADQQTSENALKEANETIERLNKQIQLGANTVDPSVDLPTEELEAYRRAEAAERTARERAERLKLQIQTLYSNTEREFSDSEEMIKSSIESVDASLSQLSATLEKIKSVFSDTQSALNEIKI